MNLFERSNFTPQEHLSKFAAKTSIEADKLHPGSQRETLIRKILAAEEAVRIDKWITSPGLRAPV